MTKKRAAEQHLEEPTEGRHSKQQKRGSAYFSVL